MTKETKLREKLLQIEQQLSTSYKTEELEQEFHSILQALDQLPEGELHTFANIIYGIFLFRSGRLDAAIERYHLAERFAIEHHHDQHLLRIFGNLGGLYSASGDTNRSFEYLLQTQTRAREAQDFTRLATVLLNLGIAYGDIGSNEEGVEKLEECIQLSEQLDLQDNKGNALLAISQIEMMRGNFASAKAHAESAFAISAKTKNRQISLLSRVRLISIYVEEQDFDRLNRMIASMEADLEETQALHILEPVQLVKAKAAQLRGDNEEALKQFEAAYETAVTLGNPQLQVNALQQWVEGYLIAKNPTEAAKILQRLEGNQKLLEDQFALNTWHLLWSQVHEALGDHKQAYEYLMKHHETRVKILTEEANNRLQRLQVQHEVDRRERETALYRQQWEAATKELAERSAYLLSKQEVLDSLENDLRNILSNASQNPLSALQQIKTRLKNIPQDEQNWEEYDRTFRKAHPNFHTILEERLPSLSKVEQKICTLLKGGLNTYEISKLLGTSERTVENHRYRLRKKLKLETTKDFAEFFSELESGT